MVIFGGTRYDAVEVSSEAQAALAAKARAGWKRTRGRDLGGGVAENSGAVKIVDVEEEAESMVCVL